MKKIIFVSLILLLLCSCQPKKSEAEAIAEAKKLMAVMGLGVKQNDEVKVTIEGPTEEADAAAVENFFKENF